MTYIYIYIQYNKYTWSEMLVMETLTGCAEEGVGHRKEAEKKKEKKSMYYVYTEAYIDRQTY